MTSKNQAQFINLMLVILQKIQENKMQVLMNGESGLCQGYSWCNYEAVDHTSIIIQRCMLGILGIVAVFILRNFIILLQYRRDPETGQFLGPTFVRIYQISIVWLICSAIKMGINIIAFELYIGQDFNLIPQPDEGSPIVILSALFNSFDMCSTFFMLSLITFIPYEWLRAFLQHISILQATKEISLDCRVLYKRCFIVLKIVKYYMFARILLLVGYFVEAGLIVYTKFGCSIASFDVSYVIGESFVILIFYVFGYYVAEKTRKHQLVFMKKSDYRRIKLQYSLLMIALFSRIFLNTFFNGLAPQILQYSPERNCFDNNKQNDFKRSLFLTIGETIMHLLPVILILIIYGPGAEPRQRNQKVSKLQQQQQSKINDRLTSDTHNINITQQQTDASYQYKRISQSN